jgi:hypothetical protein
MTGGERGVGARGVGARGDGERGVGERSRGGGGCDQPAACVSPRILSMKSGSDPHQDLLRILHVTIWIIDVTIRIPHVTIRIPHVTIRIPHVRIRIPHVTIRIPHVTIRIPCVTIWIRHHVTIRNCVFIEHLTVSPEILYVKIMDPEWNGLDYGWN